MIFFNCSGEIDFFPIDIPYLEIICKVGAHENKNAYICIAPPPPPLHTIVKLFVEHIWSGDRRIIRGNGPRQPTCQPETMPESTLG